MDGDVGSCGVGRKLWLSGIKSKNGLLAGAGAEGTRSMNGLLAGAGATGFSSDGADLASGSFILSEDIRLNSPKEIRV